MIRFWQKRLKEGIKTEFIELDREFEKLQKELRSEVAKKFSKSLAIRMVDSGSCNACEAECNALSNPIYDLERFGIHFVASPRHADVLLVSGVVTKNMLPHLLDAYEQLPSPKWVISLGDCTRLESAFEPTYAIAGALHEHIPVAHHIPGCPPSPRQIIEGILEFLKKI